MKFCSFTLGCKVNQYEAQGIESVLISRGHTQSQPGEGCDACIVNTCSVTAESARKSRQAVRRMKKLEPYAVIAVCGCLSQLEPHFADTLGADLIGGSGDRDGFALEIEALVEKQGDGSSAFRKKADEPSPCFSRTRALLKIQDGCDNYCAYCVIPYARGNARSLPLELASAHAARLDNQGFREIVVTGIEISSYGKDLDGKPPLTEVIHVISAAAPRARLRLGSLAPEAVSEAFCRELRAIPNLCNHFHLSLQSGCDATLRRMGRKYDTDTVLKAISSLRQGFPDCGITADLIVGFPGETDDEFKQTLALIKTAAFSGMHIFPFSPRPGTLAANMPGQVAKGIKRERAHLAAQAAEELAQTFKINQIGKDVEVLFERKRGGFWSGHSGNYLEVTAMSGGGKNSVQTVQIVRIDDGMIWGEII